MGLPERRFASRAERTKREEQIISGARERHFTLHRLRRGRGRLPPETFRRWRPVGPIGP